MNKLIVSVIDGQAVTTTLAIAEGTEVEHASIIKLVRTYLPDLEEFGPCRFEIDVVNRPQGGGAEREIAILNEHQATLILTYMRNSEIVRTFKKRLVKAFFEFANAAQKPEFNLPTTYLDALKALVASTEKLLLLEQENKAQAAQIEADLPKVETYEEMVSDETHSFTVREAAKILGIREKDFRFWLLDSDLIFRNSSGYWEPKASGIRRGIMSLKVERINGRLVQSAVVSMKGLVTCRHLLSRHDIFRHVVQTTTH